jgi:hypothetical protein
MKIELTEFNLLGIWIGISILSVIMFYFNIDFINYIVWFGGGITVTFFVMIISNKVKQKLKEK